MSDHKSPYGEFPKKNKIAISQIEFGEELLKMLKKFQILNAKINNAFDGDFEIECKKMQNDIEILFNLLKTLNSEGQSDIMDKLKELENRIIVLENFIKKTLVTLKASLTETNKFNINNTLDLNRSIEVYINGINYNKSDNWNTENGINFNWISSLFDLDKNDLIEVKGYLK